MGEVCRVTSLCSECGEEIMQGVLRIGEGKWTKQSRGEHGIREQLVG